MRVLVVVLLLLIGAPLWGEVVSGDEARQATDRWCFL